MGVKRARSWGLLLAARAGDSSSVPHRRPAGQCACLCKATRNSVRRRTGGVGVTHHLWTQPKQRTDTDTAGLTLGTSNLSAPT